MRRSAASRRLVVDVVGYDPSMRPRTRDGARPALRLVPTGRTVAPVEVTLPKPTLDDVEIVASVRRGDASAAAALHDRARPTIARTVTRLLGPRDVDREDLSQLSLIELERSLHGFRGECSLDTWISRVTAHSVFKELRRRRSERRIFDVSTEVASQQAADVDLDRDLTLRSALRRVRVHLESLEETKSWTVLLHDVCGYDLREIAQITDASVAAAQTRLVRGRRELHERLLADPELTDVLERLVVGTRREHDR